MRKLARQLIARERARSSSPPSESDYPALRICEELRIPLTAYAGAIGFRSLLRRALNLARAEEPRLTALMVDDTGVIVVPEDFQAAHPPSVAAPIGEALVVHLLLLLEIFIGAALTLRLVHEVWPTVAAKTPKTSQN